VAWFEVFIPGKQSGTPSMTLTVEAPNWIGALRTGLSNLGEGQESISNVMCDIKEDNSIHVTDVASHRVFRLREVKQPSAAMAAAPAEPPVEPAADPPTVLDGFSAADVAAAVATSTVEASFLEPPTTEQSGPPAAASTVEPPASPASPPPPPRTPTPPPMTAPDALSSSPRVPTSPDVASAMLAAADGAGSNGQNTIEMSVPWAAMPAPTTAALPSMASLSVAPKLPPLASPTSLVTPPATVAPPPEVTMPMPKAPAAGVDYDLTLRLPKAPPPPPTHVQPAPVTVTPAEAPVSAEVLHPPTPAVPAAPPAAPAPPPAAPAPPAAAPAPAPAPLAAAALPKAPTKAWEPTERLERAPAAPLPTVPLAPAPAPPPRRPSGQFGAAPKPATREAPHATEPAPIGRMPAADQAAVADAIADVFDATQELLLESSLTPVAIAEALLDIALTHIPAESGSFYLADLNAHTLRFAAVRGPKADAIKKGNFSVHIGQGIVGFCALEGICLVVSDIQKDPRHYSAVATAVGYTPHDMLCASAEVDGRLYGAIQLINATKPFSPVDMEVLRYLGLTAAGLLERHFNTTN
jgi:hypothetical protein